MAARKKRAGGRLLNPRVDAMPAEDGDDDAGPKLGFQRASDGALRQRKRIRVRPQHALRPCTWTSHLCA